MSVETIGAIGALQDAATIGLQDIPLAPMGTPPAGFGDWFAQQVGTVNHSIVASEGDMRRLAAGEVQNLHEVMIRMEEAKLSFQLLAQVRNRMLDAYQEVMRTQV